jgi:hypothetical protein
MTRPPAVDLRARAGARIWEEWDLGVPGVGSGRRKVPGASGAAGVGTEGAGRRLSRGGQCCGWVYPGRSTRRGRPEMSCTTLLSWF